MTKRYVSDEPLLQLAEEVEDLRLDRDVDGGDGLVEHDEARMERERPCDADALALAARELAGVCGGVLLPEADELEQLGDTPSAGRRGRATARGRSAGTR